jgi:hypothetical protein
MNLIDVVILTVAFTGNSQYPETVYNHTFYSMEACENTRKLVFSNKSATCVKDKELVVTPTIQQNTYAPR